MKRHTESGFTLIEIMIVVAIIALLAAIAIPNVLRARTSANEAAAIGNMRALVSSLEMYRSVNNVYPVTAGNFLTLMYPGGATPNYGPPSFNHAMDGTACPPGAASSCTQGYRYTYLGVGGSTYTLLVVPDSTSTGTRGFRADGSPVILHCAPATNATTLANLATELTIDAAPNICNGDPAS